MSTGRSRSGSSSRRASTPATAQSRSSASAIDTAIGAIPLAGDAFDFVFKANERNLRIVLDHLKRGPVEIEGQATRLGERRF